MFIQSTVSFKSIKYEWIINSCIISYGLYYKAACITRNFFELQNPWFIIKSGFKSNAGYNGVRTVVFLITHKLPGMDTLNLPYQSRSTYWIKVSNVSKLLIFYKRFLINCKKKYLQTIATLNSSEAYKNNAINTAAQNNLSFTEKLFLTKNPSPWMAVFEAKLVNAFCNPFINSCRNTFQNPIFMEHKRECEN